MNIRKAVHVVYSVVSFAFGALVGYLADSMTGLVVNVGFFAGGAWIGWWLERRKQTHHFDYAGMVYARPSGRGICLLDPPMGSPDMLTELDLDHGHYRAELRFVPVPSPPDTTE